MLLADSVNAKRFRRFSLRPGDLPSCQTFGSKKSRELSLPALRCRCIRDLTLVVCASVSDANLLCHQVVFFVCFGNFVIAVGK